MSHLTIDKMDRINFLITEVSLECLGNKFFDIYGNQNQSLLSLVSFNTLKRSRTDSDSESDLWTALMNEKKPIIEKRTRAIENKTKTEPKRKRRASFSTTNEPDTGNATNDPESLLVPMTNAPKAAKVMQRRSTIAVQLAKHRRQPATTPPNRNRQAVANQRSINSRPNFMRKSDAASTTPNLGEQSTVRRGPIGPKPKSKKIAEIKQDLRRDINQRKH